jgi:tetratricopeptide (TPR) repeat protein
MSYALGIDSRPGVSGRSGRSVARRSRRPHFPAPAALLAALLAGLALVGCAAARSEEERTVLTTRSGETLIQVTESEEGGAKVVRVKTQFRGEESSVVMQIDEPVYEVEIPLSIEQVRPAEPKTPEQAAQRNFSDLLAAQYLEKAQELTLDGDYNGALRQVNLVLTVNPDHVQALTMKGSIYYAMGNYQLANQTWEQVLVLDPSNEEVRNFQDFLKSQPGAVQPSLPGVSPGEAPQPPTQVPQPPAQAPGGGAGGGAPGQRPQTR